MVPGSGARGKYEKQGHASTVPIPAPGVNARESDPTSRTYAVRHAGPASPESGGVWGPTRWRGRAHTLGRMGRAGRVVMFNDGECGFCLRAGSEVHRLGVHVDARTLQTEDLASLGIDRARALVEMAAIDAEGNLHYGHRSWAAILATGPLPWRLVGASMTRPPVEPLARAVYRWVSENRAQLPGGTPACELPRVEGAGQGQDPAQRPQLEGVDQGTRRTAPSEADVAIEA